MTEQEHLLTCLMEECAEVSHRIGKALRFGLDDTDPLIPGSPPERILIAQELTDLFAVRELLFDTGILHLNRNESDAIVAKKEKVFKFMDYARKRGTLT